MDRRRPAPRGNSLWSRRAGLSRPLFVTVAVWAGMCGVGACATSSTARFYVLTVESQAPAAASAPSDLPSVAVGPVELPAYLGRPQIVTRGTPNRLDLAEFDRWAEPLESSFTRTVSENLATLLATQRMLPYPWKGSEDVDFRVTMKVTRFDAVLGNQVVLDARWTLLDGDHQEIVPTTRSTITSALSSSDFGGVVAAMSRAVAELCGEIATAIRQHHGT